MPLDDYVRRMLDTNEPVETIIPAYMEVGIGVRIMRETFLEMVRRFRAMENRLYHEP